MPSKKTTLKQIRALLEGDIDFLLRLRDLRPDISKEISGFPRKTSLKALKKHIKKAEDRLAALERQKKAVEEKMVDELLSKKELIKDMKRIAKTVIATRFPEASDEIAG